METETTKRDNRIYVTETWTELESIKQKITFKNIPINAKFNLQTDFLTENLELNGFYLFVKYAAETHGGTLILTSVEIKDNNGSKHEIQINEIFPQNEYTFSLSSDKVSVFISHPELDRSSRYPDIHEQAKKEYEEKGIQHLVVYIEEKSSGVTIPLSLSPYLKLREHLLTGFVPLAWQMFCVPNENFLTAEQIGITPTFTPFVISNLFEQHCVRFAELTEKTQNNTARFFIGVSQIFGHGIRMLEYAMVTQNKGVAGRYKFFVIPNERIYGRYLSFREQGLADDLVSFWVYGCEPGYGGDLLPLDAEHPQAGKMALALCTQNPELVEEILSHPKTMLYTESKQDIVFINLLAKCMGINMMPFARVHTVLEDEVTTTELPPSLQEIKTRNLQAVKDGFEVLKKVGLNSLPRADGPAFWKQKIRACFDGFAFYMTLRDDPSYVKRQTAELRNLKTRIIPIPHVAPKTMKIDITKSEAITYVLDELKKLNLFGYNLIEQLMNQPDSRVVLMALSTSQYLFKEETIIALARAAEFLQNKNYLFLIAVETEDSLNQILQQENIKKPHNFVGVGFRNDIDRFIKVSDLFIGQSGKLGTVFRLTNFEIPLILLPPDTLVLSDIKKIAEISTKSENEKIGLVQVTNEINQEQSVIFFDLLHKFKKAGIKNVEYCVLNVIDELDVKEVIKTLDYALNQRKLIIRAIKSIPTIFMDNLVDVLEIFRNNQISLDQMEAVVYKYFGERK